MPVFIILNQSKVAKAHDEFDEAGPHSRR